MHAFRLKLEMVSSISTLTNLNILRIYIFGNFSVVTLDTSAAADTGTTTNSASSNAADSASPNTDSGPERYVGRFGGR